MPERLGVHEEEAHMRTPEVIQSHLIDCTDTAGRRIRIGAGATEDGGVLVMVPMGRDPHLNQAQALALITAVRRAVSDAARRS